MDDVSGQPRTAPGPGGHPGRQHARCRHSSSFPEATRHVPVRRTAAGQDCGISGRAGGRVRSAIRRLLEANRIITVGRHTGALPGTREYRTMRMANRPEAVGEYTNTNSPGGGTLGAQPPDGLIRPCPSQAPLQHITGPGPHQSQSHQRGS